jgi:glycine oxidase
MPAQGGSKVKDLVVVGGGVIGLSCAWRAAQAGLRVTLRDPAPGTGSSWVAGGMLAPVTEAWPGEEGLLALGLESLELWPAFAEELSAAAGQSAGLHPEGTVVAATGSGDRAELDALAQHLARLGRPVERLNGRELRRLEPALGPDVRGGLSVPGDLSVDNRALLAALRAAAEKAGVVVEERAWEPGEAAPGTLLICAGAH